MKRPAHLTTLRFVDFPDEGGRSPSDYAVTFNLPHGPRSGEGHARRCHDLG